MNSEALRVLDGRIASTVARTLEAHPDWPCRRGCDTCCRSLKQLPVVTRAEWDRLAGALQKLPDDTRQLVRKRLQFASATDRVCPFLDTAKGECTVYEARPVACRSYGFFADREGELCCDDISHQIATRIFTDVTWGNQEAIERALDEFGERLLVTDWFDSR